MLSDSDKNSPMSDATYAQELFHEAFPVHRHGSVKAALYAAYRFMAPKLTKDFTPRRARSLRDGKARRVDAEEMAALELARMVEARNEQRALQERLQRLDAEIAAWDQREAGCALASQGRGIRKVGRVDIA